MPTVNSVSGPIDTADLGFTLMHEHILVQSPGVKENFPVFDRPKEIERAVQMLKDVQSRGVKTMVDLTVSDWRDMPLVQEVVRRTGMQLIVATGIYHEVPHYFRADSGRSVESIADLFVRDITDGIMDTGVKAGIIKCATDEPGVTPDVERILRAAAKAHRATGVPISTHTHAASEMGTKQQDVFESEGVDLGRVIIGHSGDSEDTGYLKRLIERGSYIGMDRFGIDIFLPTEKRIATVVKMCELGHADKMVLSHDTNSYIDWVDPPLRERLLPNWHFNHIPDDILPALRERGVTEEQITTMTVDNPRRIFERQGAY
jgi:phosphotriesterase-related protein